MKTLPLACCTTPKWSVKDLFCFYVMTENGKYEKHRLVEIALIFLKRHQVICKYVTHFLLTFRYGKRKRSVPPPSFLFYIIIQWFFCSSPEIKLGCMCPMSINEFDTRDVFLSRRSRIQTMRRCRRRRGRPWSPWWES